MEYHARCCATAALQACEEAAPAYPGTLAEWRVDSAFVDSLCRLVPTDSLDGAMRAVLMAADLEAAHQRVSCIEQLLMLRRGLGVDRIEVTHVVNPTYAEQLRDWTDRWVTECVLRALNQPSASERHKRILYSICRARGTSPEVQASYPITLHHDFAEVVRQKISIWTQNWSTAPAVATTVQDHMFADIQSGRHGVWVARSQGNFVVAQGIGKLKERVPQLQQGVCTAVVSLASPVKMTQFGINATFVRGFTTKYDILLQWGLGDEDAIKVPSAIVADIDRRPNNYVWDWKLAHAVDANYFLDATGADMVKGGVDSLLDACEALP